MSDNQETQNVPNIVPTVSSSVEAPVIEPTLPALTSPNPKTESQPPSAFSPTQLSSGSYRSRKISTSKKFMVVTSTSASPEKMVDEDIVDGEENQEISSLPVEESFAKEQVTLELQEHEAIENMISIAAEGSMIGGYEGVSKFQGEDNGTEVEGRELVLVETSAPDSTTGEPTEGPDPSSPEEPSGSNRDKTPSSSQEPQVSTDPAPSTHFYDEPLLIMVFTMRYLSEEENEDSEEKIMIMWLW
ncbi:uncharacterized protein [Nicotiana tomentosiformis]|uniref:uncharacterized protein n=1 Tax=Nicotiana tomentosiformis TaxID=4098 RepID=UPI00388C89D2